MATVGVALVNGVRRSGYLFAPGFVGDGSLLTNVNTSNVTCAKTGQLAYYVNPTTIGGNPSEVVINGDLFVNGNIVSSNVTTYESPVLVLGSDQTPDVHTRGLVISDFLMSYSNSVVTFGIHKSSETDIQLYHSSDQPIQVDILGSLRAKSFSGDASNVTNVFDAPQGSYGDALTVPRIKVDSNGRPSVNLVPIQVSLENVTTVGNTTSNTIQFINPKVSFVTSGKVGICNQDPQQLLCVGDGVEISESSIVAKETVTASRFLGSGSDLVKTCDVTPGTVGDPLSTLITSVDERGRLSSINRVPIKSTLQTVTDFGSSSGCTIELTNRKSLVTTGSVGVGTSPRNLMSIGNSTDFDGVNASIGGSVRAGTFIGNGTQVSNTVDIPMGSYGNGWSVPQIIVSDQGRIKGINQLNLQVTLEQVTKFSPYSSSCLMLTNKQSSIQTDGDIIIKNGKNLIFRDGFNNPVGSFGQDSAESSPQVNLLGKCRDSFLNVANWDRVSINSGLAVDSSGFVTMDGCIMNPGKGLFVNTQQVSNSSDDLSLTKDDAFKWFSFRVSGPKTVYLPDPDACQAGIWIGITNIGRSTINVTNGTVIKPGKSKRFLCVSELSNGGPGVKGDLWILA